MSTVTVQEFAKELGRPVGELLEQLRSAGVIASEATSTVSAEDKVALLNFLRDKAHGAGASAQPRKITLRRRETSEIKLSGARGAPSKTVSNEVRKKRTILKRDGGEAVPTMDEDAQRQIEEAAARANASGTRWLAIQPRKSMPASRISLQAHGPLMIMAMRPSLKPAIMRP